MKEETEKNPIEDPENSYKRFEPYLAYIEKTNEKQKLIEYIKVAYEEGKFPIKPDQEGKHILDIGSGNGVLTEAIAAILSKHTVDAIERSPAQFEFARANHQSGNVNYSNMPFEDFQSSALYNAILASHVLQYINSDTDIFVKKIAELLESQGEAWLIQQTQKGMAEAIAHQKSYLTSPRFNNWKTFEDYEKEIREIFEGSNDITVATDFLDSSIEQINFQNPTENDKLRLEFIFCLDKPFDEQSQEFKDHLATLHLGSEGRISHPNGILKLKKF
jgi:2-polyprenyl-3-methyl-5-hydroxy-6-metoxy-1,4-benzoquinol methylase